MDPEVLELFAQTLLQVVVLILLIFGLIGLLIPIFPGLTVMWIGTLIYAVVQASIGAMTWVDWLLFVLITILMIGGNIGDNIIIAKHVRDKNVPWSSIIWAFIAGVGVSLVMTPIAGMLAAPAGLYFAEWRRLRDKGQAFANTKAWMTGWGWSVAAKIGLGIVMIIFWGLWAWL